MNLTKRQKGNFGELAAKAFLEKKGMVFVERNYYSRYGEIDLVMKEGDEFVFVEVKLRKRGHGEDSVTRSKLKKIVKTVWDYFNKRNVHDQFWRVDIVSIEKNGPDWDARHFISVSEK